MGEYISTEYLSFAQVNILRHDLAEFIINDGIELDITHINEAEEFLAMKLTSPYSVLFNKKNHYSFNFKAQVKVGTQSALNAIGVVCYTESSRRSTESLAQGVPRTVEWNVKIFSARTEALNWLLLQQDNLINTESFKSSLKIF